ncbi:hypothetical protein FRC14_003804 [Serendipita sp. 396]|nr:hypothetical protein FRC14_003804 [Serendipita sp. 396]KAG8783855.1 hypothetical protein FRC15_004430 [Serendipita sp. 397]KAG8798812.1 hypothetical protein FRC16_006506 [Serendipita sp. 398]KAG8867139.1 hypothetical protein FRC20_006608 [Serendipita sp. 405]
MSDVDATDNPLAALWLAMAEIAMARATWTPKVLAWLKVVERAMEADTKMISCTRDDKTPIDVPSITEYQHPCRNTIDDLRREINDLKDALSTRLDLLTEEIAKSNRSTAAPQEVEESGPVQPQPLVVGSFSTTDVRPWDEPRHQTSKYLPFAQSYTSPPHLFLGLNSLDIDCRTNIRVMSDITDITTEGFRLNVKSWCDTILYSSRVGWIELPPNNQYGRFSTEDDSPSLKPRTKKSRRITFSPPFDRPPRVVVALSSLDIQAGKNCRVVLRATSIENDGFVIHIDTWGDSVLHMAKADWFAYPADSTDIIEGIFTVQDPNGKKRNHIGTVDFVGKLSKIPNVFVGINMLDVGCEANLRISAFVESITATGMTWHIDTWADTLLFGAGISYVCV